MCKVHSESADLRFSQTEGEDRTGQPATPVDVTTLMQGRREVVILHGGQRYRLRITSNDRLILTK